MYPTRGTYHSTLLLVEPRLAPISIRPWPHLPAPLICSCSFQLPFAYGTVKTAHFAARIAQLSRNSFLIILRHLTFRPLDLLDYRNGLKLVAHIHAASGLAHRLQGVDSSFRDPTGPTGSRHVLY